MTTEKQTPLQKAIFMLEQQINYLQEMDLLGVLLENELIHKSNQIKTIQLLLAKLLEEEKQMVIDAYKSGEKGEWVGNGNAEQYFKETYK
jgi:hypothetical protein